MSTVMKMGWRHLVVLAVLPCGCSSFSATIVRIEEDAGQKDVAAAVADSGTASGTGGEGLNVADSGTALGTGGKGSYGEPDAQVPNSISVEIATTPDIVGYPTKLKAQVSSDSDGGALTYSWSITDVPKGSAVTSASLSSKTVPDPAFEPDLGGDYGISLTVSDGTATQSTSKVVSVPTIDIGYLTVSGNETSYTRAGAMVKSDGTDSRVVGCYFSDAATSEAIWLDMFRSEGQYSMRAYYPSVVSAPTTLVYSYEDSTTVGMHAQVAGPLSRCTTNPPSTIEGGYAPKFSPDGRRASFMTPRPEYSDQSFAIKTIGVDGSEPHLIRTDAMMSVVVATGAEWVDGAHVVWADMEMTADKSLSWNVVYVAGDIDGAFSNNLVTSKVMNCSGAKNPFGGIGHVAISNGQMFLTDVTGASPYSYTIWRLDPIGGEFLCDTTASSNHIIAANHAHDFELSPDGTRILFFRSLPGGAGLVDSDASEILFGPSSGDGPFTTLLASNGAANIGAHWVAGGRQIVWTSTSFVTTGPADASALGHNRPTSSSIWIANADGTHMRELQRVNSTSSDVKMLHTGSSSCSTTRAASIRGQSLWVLLAMMTSFAAARRVFERRKHPVAAWHQQGETRH